MAQPRPDHRSWALAVGGVAGAVLGAAFVAAPMALGPDAPAGHAASSSVYRVPLPAAPVRLEERADEVRLTVCARRYEGPSLPSVWVAGVVNVAEPGFYRWVDGLLAEQDVVFYEGVEGPERPPTDKAGLGDIAAVLGLVEQSGIDTTRPDWHNSDMTVTELEAALYAAGAEADYVQMLLHEVDDDYGRAIQELGGVEPRFVAHARHSLMASISIPPATGDSPEDKIYRDVLIEARDAVVIADLLAVAERPEVESVGILYGVAHLDDLDRMLTAEGWHGSGESCETAMRVRLMEIGLGHVQLRQVRARMTSARMRTR
ncbi:MAG: hypothetical protein ACI8PZ_005365 [Myxococcota bacterium]|jgi:hypothetical protein